MLAKMPTFYKKLSLFAVDAVYSQLHCSVLKHIQELIQQPLAFMVFLFLSHKRYAIHTLSRFTSGTNHMKPARALYPAFVIKTSNRTSSRNYHSRYQSIWHECNFR